MLDRLVVMRRLDGSSGQCTECDAVMTGAGIPSNSAALLRQFRATVDQAERVRLIEQIYVRSAQDEATEALKTLLFYEVVMNDPNRAREYGLVSGAILPDDWRREAYRVLIENLFQTDEAFWFVQQVPMENDDSNCRIEAIGILAQHFPNHPKTFDVLTQWADQYSGHAQAKALSAIVDNFAHLPEARRYLLRAAESSVNLAPREAAIEALGKHHAGRSETRSELEKNALRGSSTDRAELDFSSLRALQEQEAAAAAVRTLAREFPESYEFLLERARLVAAPREAPSVFYSLAEAFSDRPETMSVLMDRARQGALRQSAVDAIRLYIPDDPQVLPFLLERATEDQDRWPRQSAIIGLASRFARHAAAEGQIISSAKSDPSEIVRTAAVGALGKHFPRNRDAIACLIDRLKNDDHPDVRRKAADALENGFSQFSAARRALRSAGYGGKKGRLQKLLRSLFKGLSGRR